MKVNKLKLYKIKKLRGLSNKKSITFPIKTKKLRLYLKFINKAIIRLFRCKTKLIRCIFYIKKNIYLNHLKPKLRFKYFKIIKLINFLFKSKYDILYLDKKIKIYKKFHRKLNRNVVKLIHNYNLINSRKTISRSRIDNPITYDYYRLIYFNLLKNKLYKKVNKKFYNNLFKNLMIRMLRYFVTKPFYSRLKLNKLMFRFIKSKQMIAHTFIRIFQQLNSVESINLNSTLSNNDNIYSKFQIDNHLIRNNPSYLGNISTYYYIKFLQFVLLANARILVKRTSGISKGRKILKTHRLFMKGLKSYFRKPRYFFFDRNPSYFSRSRFKRKLKLLNILKYHKSIIKPKKLSFRKKVLKNISKFLRKDKITLNQFIKLLKTFKLYNINFFKFKFNRLIVLFRGVAHLNLNSDTKSRLNWFVYKLLKYKFRKYIKKIKKLKRRKFKKVKTHHKLFKFNLNFRKYNLRYKNKFRKYKFRKKRYYKYKQKKKPNLFILKLKRTPYLYKIYKIYKSYYKLHKYNKRIIKRRSRACSNNIYIYLNSTKSNFFFTIVDPKGNVKNKYNAGSFRFKKADRKSTFVVSAIKPLLLNILRMYLSKRNNLRIIIRLKGYKYKLKELVKKFWKVIKKESRFYHKKKVRIRFQDITSIAHNGCRKIRKARK